MPFNLDQLNPTKIFIWPESDEKDEEFVELRLVPDEMNREIFKKIGAKPTKQLVFDPKSRQPQYVKDFDLNDKQQDDFSEMTWDYSIVSWHLVTTNGDEIECTKENKLKFMKNSPKFASWIADCLESMRSDLKVMKEEAEKN
jgi:hypothetical protein